MAAAEEERTACAELGSRGSPSRAAGSPLSPGGAASSTWSRAGVPADRMQAARASAAALAASAVRVGYYSARLARARGPTSGTEGVQWTVGGSSSAEGSPLATHGVATAAVRAAAAFTPYEGNKVLTPISLFAEDETDMTTTVGAESSAACQRMQTSGTATPLPNGSLASACDDSPDDTSSSGSSEVLLESDCGTNTDQRSTSAAPECDEQGPNNPGETERRLTVPTTADSASTCKEVDAFTDSAADKGELLQAESCQNAAGQEIPGAVQADTGKALQAALDDTSAGDVWDVVVQRTFISVVPRQKVMVHTASAPGRLVACTENGRTSSRRCRRNHRRRGGRGRSTSRPGPARGEKMTPAPQAADDEGADHIQKEIDACKCP